MKNIISILLVIVGTFFTSCDKNDCSLVVCAPNSTFIFELVNTNDENLLFNEILQLEDIKILNSDSQNILEFALVDTNDTKVIELNAVTIGTGFSNLVVQVLEKDIFELSIAAERTEGECCDVTNFNSLEIVNSEFSYDETNAIYTFIVASTD